MKHVQKIGVINNNVGGSDVIVISHGGIVLDLQLINYMLWVESYKSGQIRSSSLSFSKNRHRDMQPNMLATSISNAK